ncbi:SUKH-4 family immunity protein [Streptomyces coffeae]|uniref:SUKH-4 family immunity protein n=1 Tax=Streptomyces coffeae TaxID=621382 RepID=A0ABS1N8R4_9ACTN|nr:SUKH-4 family immunity protein [Streptomyces coffeae]MBL1096469.1 SUKH-4 family immunity protein [Streptomyces coffeae]
MDTGPTARNGCRLAAEALPDGLTHGPSREFLVERGLPEVAADLDFTALCGAGPAPFTTHGGQLIGDGRLLVLGTTDYCGSRVVLDGATGAVVLAGWAGATSRGPAGAELVHDPLASSLPALAELLDTCEWVSESALRADAYDGRRGPGALAEVIEAAAGRLRAADPELFGAEAAPAHWRTCLLVRSLAWGARPGPADGPAYLFDPDLVRDLARLDGEGRVRHYRPEELPDRLTHEPTRRLLTESGLPLGGELFSVGDEPLRTMAEAHPDTFAGTGEPGADHDGSGTATGRSHQRDFLAIGWWPHDLAVALDGATGRLELPDWYGEGEPAAYLNRDLSALLYAWWIYERLRDEWHHWDHGAAADTWRVFDPFALLSSRVDAMVEAVDPEAFRTSAHSWRMLAEDPYTGGLLSH